MISRRSQRSILTVIASACLLLALTACSGESAEPTQVSQTPDSRTEPTQVSQTPDSHAEPTQVSQTPDSRTESTIEAHSGRIYLIAPVGVHQEGWAELRDTPEGLSVEVDVTPAEPVAQPAHIHFGTCTQLGDVFRSLENIIGGRSSTVVQGITLADVANGGMSINLHKAYSDFDTFTACGEIPALP